MKERIGLYLVTNKCGRTDLFLGKPENEKMFMASVPLGRGSSPKDVANACTFLASDEANYLTGEYKQALVRATIYSRVHISPRAQADLALLQ